MLFRKHNFLVDSVANTQELLDRTAAEKPDLLVIARENEAFKMGGAVHRLWIDIDWPDDEQPPFTFMIRPASTPQERNKWVLYPSRFSWTPDTVFERPVHPQEIVLFAKRVTRAPANNDGRYKI